MACSRKSRVALAFVLVPIFVEQCNAAPATLSLRGSDFRTIRDNFPPYVRPISSSKGYAPYRVAPKPWNRPTFLEEEEFELPRPALPQQTYPWSDEASSYLRGAGLIGPRVPSSEPYMYSPETFASPPSVSPIQQVPDETGPSGNTASSMFSVVAAAVEEQACCGDSTTTTTAAPLIPIPPEWAYESTPAPGTITVGTSAVAESQVSPASLVSPESQVSPASLVSPESQVSPVSLVSPVSQVSPVSLVSPASQVAPVLQISPTPQVPSATLSVYPTAVVQPVTSPLFPISTESVEPASTFGLTIPDISTGLRDTIGEDPLPFGQIKDIQLPRDAVSPYPSQEIAPISFDINATQASFADAVPSWRLQNPHCHSIDGVHCTTGGESYVLTSSSPVRIFGCDVGVVAGCRDSRLAGGKEVYKQLALKEIEYQRRKALPPRYLPPSFLTVDLQVEKVNRADSELVNYQAEEPASMTSSEGAGTTAAFRSNLNFLNSRPDSPPVSILRRLQQRRFDPATSSPPTVETEREQFLFSLPAAISRELPATKIFPVRHRGEPCPFEGCIIVGDEELEERREENAYKADRHGFEKKQITEKETKHNNSTAPTSTPTTRPIERRNAETLSFVETASLGSIENIQNGAGHVEISAMNSVRASLTDIKKPSHVVQIPLLKANALGNLPDSFASGSQQSLSFSSSDHFDSTDTLDNSVVGMSAEDINTVDDTMKDSVPNRSTQENDVAGKVETSIPTIDTAQQNLTDAAALLNSLQRSLLTSAHESVQANQLKSPDSEQLAFLWPLMLPS